jgi:L-rhamnose mutarotase
MKRFCLALDLKDDAQAIAQYEAYHQSVWPEIIESIKSSGIENMTIYRVQNRLIMLIEAHDDFSFEQKAVQDAQNLKVQEWEALMDRFQQRIPGTPEGAKWALAEPIFKLN